MRFSNPIRYKLFNMALTWILTYVCKLCVVISICLFCPAANTQMTVHYGRPVMLRQCAWCCSNGGLKHKSKSDWNGMCSNVSCNH